MRIPRAHAWPTFFTHQSSLFFSLQVVSKRFSSKNKFTGLICKTATPFVQVWHSKELQKCLLYSLWNAFRKKIFNFYSLIKQFCCCYSAGWVQKKKSQIKNNASPTFKVYPQGYSIKIVSNDGSKYFFPFDSNQSPKQFLKSKGIVCKESI